MWEKALETESSAPLATINGLIEGNEYQFRVIAVNKAGQSEPSDAGKTFVAKPRYLAPKIDRRNLRDITISAGSTLKLDASIVGEYVVTATNSSGKDTVQINVVITDKPTAPKGPLQISDVHKEGCHLKWKRPEDDGGTPIEYFQIDKLDPETGCWIPCCRSTEPQANVTGLNPGSEYKFRVSAVNAEGESEPLVGDESIIAKNPFDEPGKPENLKPTDWDKDHIDLAWTPPK
ncbi:Twitchin [Eumeta japonica]|uniref:Twitchin n=1 Tax=Eumeta variegata TaxID=151549 RepID=A0A4C1T337_EUMVA|nr:Twitchin [Eumeta japonica]